MRSSWGSWTRSRWTARTCTSSGPERRAELMETASRMGINPGRISGIVAEVLERLEAESPTRPGGTSSPLGVHADLAAAVAAAPASFEAYDQVPFAIRKD